MKALALDTSVGTTTDDPHVVDGGVAPDSLAGLFGSFADVALVGIAAASLDVLGRHASPEEWLRWTGHALDDSPVEVRTTEWVRGVGHVTAAFDPRIRQTTKLADDPRDREVMAAGLLHHGLGTRAGPVWRIEVSPGSIAFRQSDPLRSERTRERQAEAAWVDRRVRVATGGGLDDDGPRGRGRVTSWSQRSRSKMTERLNSLDYTPMVSRGAPALLTVTYPGEWLAVAPNSATCTKHVRALMHRYRRAWGESMIAVWKREFQRRGAPHYHFLMVPPTGVSKDGRPFRQWLADEWVAIVGAQSCGGRPPEWGEPADCCERHRHLAAHQHEKVVDVAEGARYADPRRVGVYFAKHGAYRAKDYQNEAPAEWLEDPSEGVGRFWGVWGLKPAVAAVVVDPDVSKVLRRVARRWESATMLRERPGHRVEVEGRVYRAPTAPVALPVEVWRKVQTVDRVTGEIGFRWRKRRTSTRLRPHLSQRSGFLCVNDGPALAMDLGRYAESVVAPVAWQRGLRRPLP